MRADLEGWTIVLAGAWNQAIFTPRWISRNMLMEEGEQQVELGIVLGSDERLFRFPSKKVEVRVAPTRLVIRPVVGDDDTMQTVNVCATRVLESLRHTPIVAVGFNYLFRTDDPPTAVNSALDGRDAGQLAECSLTPSESSITRQLKGVTIHGAPILNLTFHRDHTSASCTAAFNYHYPKAEDTPFTTSMTGAFIGLRNHAFEVLRAYGATTVN